MSKIQNALIVGGGLAGLTAASAMARAGVRCDVVDITDKPAGAAITLLNRAIDAMAEIGALEACLAEGKATSAKQLFAYFDAAGEPIATPPMLEPPSSDLPQGLLIYRPDLARILRKSAEDAGTRVRIGLTIDALHQSPDSVAVTFSDGSEDVYDLLVGADGVRSKTRSLILQGDEAIQPKYSGATMFRWMVAGVPDVGPAGHYQSEYLVVTRRMHDGRLYIATGNRYEQAPHFDRAEARRTVHDILGSFTAPLIREIHNRFTDDTNLIINDYDWLLVPNPWYRGRVLLIGDAAHATTAHLGSGGGMAIEDGVVLGQEIAVGESAEAVLNSFMARRYERVRLVVENSVKLDQMHQHAAFPADQNKVRQQAMAALANPY